MKENDDYCRAVLRAGFAPFFSVCDQLYGIAEKARDIVNAGASYKKLRDSESHIVRAFAAGAIARSLGQFRGMNLLIEVGLAPEVETLLRSQYELWLAIRYVLFPAAPSGSYGPDLCSALAKLPKSPKTSEEHRALLYLNFPELKRIWRVDEGARNANGPQPTAQQRASAVSSLATIEQAIGNEWCRAIKKSKSYSGLKVNQLAEFCAADHVHRTYGLMCIAAHANDAGRHLEISNSETEVHYVSRPKIIAQMFPRLLTQFGIFYHDLNARFGMGLDEELNAMALRLKTILDSTGQWDTESTSSGAPKN